MKPESAFAEVEKLGLEVDVVARTTYDRFVWILGQKLDAEDLYETMCEVHESPSYTHMNNPAMVKAMKSIGLISGTSGSWGTSVVSDHRLKDFLAMLKEALKKSKSEIV